MKRFITLSLMLLWGALSLHAQQTYTAKGYETVENIAKTYRLSPADIVKANSGLKDAVQKGQTINIPVSKYKHYNTQRPESFKIHLVKGGETFFGLSQRYRINIDDIKRSNLDLYTRELQEGERITIPVFNKDTEVVQKVNPGQKRYVVKPLETLWKIAKNHNVSVEELERINKGEKGFDANNLRGGQEIWVPASAVDTSDTATPNIPAGKNLVLYNVEKGEGFYSLERKFGLSEADLIKLNPELKSGLKSDSQIWIPKENFNRYSNAAATTTSDYNFKNANTSLRSASSPSKVKEISYILPFKVSDVGGGNKMELRTRLKSNKLTPIATDFYSGALMALDSLQKMGYKFKVNTYDSEADDMQKIVSTPAVKNSQIVIGPFTTKRFNDLASAITSPNTALLAPLANKNITLNPNVFQTLPSDEAQQARMIDYVAKHYSDANIMILADSKNGAIREKLERAFPNAKVITEMSAAGFNNALSPTKENFVLLQSNDVGYVSLVVRILHNALKVGKGATAPKITLATLDKGSVFDSNSISNSQLSDLHFTYPTVNKYSNGSDAFSQRYLKTYGVLPNKYAIRGFDITMDAVLRLGVSGNFTGSSSQVGETSYLENKFAYQKNAYRGGGYENQGVYIVQYDDMEVKELQ